MSNAIDENSKKDNKATGLADIAKKLTEVVGDLSTLEVYTYTGKLEATLIDDNNKIKWDALFTTATKSPTNTDQNNKEHEVKATINLALATKINIDGDATHFISSNPIPEYVLKTHADAVKNGSEFRAQIINFLAGKFSGVI